MRSACRALLLIGAAGNIDVIPPLPQPVRRLVRFRAGLVQHSFGNRSGWRRAEETAEIQIHILAWLLELDIAALQQHRYCLLQLLGGNPRTQPGDLGNGQLAVEQDQELQRRRGNLSRAPHQLTGSILRRGIDIQDIGFFQAHRLSLLTNANMKACAAAPLVPCRYAGLAREPMAAATTAADSRMS